MATPLLGLTNCCFGTLDTLETEKLVAASATIDTLVSLTALVLGILGLTAVITMPAAASYALIGISAGITVLWIALLLRECSKPSQ